MTVIASETLRRRREPGAIAAIKARCAALGVTEVHYTGSPPRWWLAIAATAHRAGAVLLIGRAGAQPLIVMTLAAAEALAGLGASE